MRSRRPTPIKSQADPFDHPHWLFEVKHEGIRALAVVRQGETRFLSRNGQWLSGFRRLATALSRQLGVDEAILDGEIAVPDETGRTRLARLTQRPQQARFYAFDLVWLSGQDTRAVPLLARKERLRTLLPSASDLVVYVDHVLEHGILLHRMACQRGLQGIVAKRADIAYDTTSMRTGWIEIANPRYRSVSRQAGSQGARVAKRTTRR